MLAHVGERPIGGLTASNREPRQQEQGDCGWQSECQVTRHQPRPICDYRRALQSDGNVDGIGLELAIGKEALDAVELRGPLVSSALRVVRYPLAKMAIQRQNLAHQMVTRRASQHRAVRTYQSHQEVFEVDNRPIIPDKVGQFCRYKDQTISAFLGRSSINSDDAELRSLSEAPGLRRFDIDRLPPAPVDPQIVGRLYGGRRHRKNDITRCETAAWQNKAY